MSFQIRPTLSLITEQISNSILVFAETPNDVVLNIKQLDYPVLVNHTTTEIDDQTPQDGMLTFDSTLDVIKYYSGSWNILSTSTGDVTLNGVQTLTNKSLVNNNTLFIDSIDPTKSLAFQSSSASTSTKLTLSSSITSNRTITFPDVTDTLVSLTASQTLTNKTLTAPVIQTITNTGTLTLPSTTDTLVGRATTDTLTNKTLTAPVISTISNGGTVTIPSGTDTLVGRATTDTLTNKTLTAPAISTITNTGTLTLPSTTDTLVGRATTDTLTNKTLTAPVISTISNGGTVTIPSGTDTLVTLAASQTLTNKIFNSTRQPVFIAVNNVSQSIGSGTFVIVNFQSTEFNQGSPVSNSSGTFTISTAGVYLILFSAEFAANATGERVFALQRNSSTIVYSSGDALPTLNYGASISSISNTTVGNTFRVTCFQNTGAALNIPSGSARMSFFKLC